MKETFNVIKTETYRGWLIELRFSSRDNTFTALSKHLSTTTSTCGMPLATDALNQIKEQIDAFLETTPKTYEGLADAISNSLIWSGYEDCSVDSQVLEVLVEGFLKAREDK